ncbi:putative oxidoreductase [Thermocatellispora tengchongensis]|uniref:Putative oxidoreductase n=1 Tax=Thermocatellispora tengchongensis TaxID=1073253 RepID=A0A840PN10_9ACTN|nr:DoxX family protein [Thermocatellispora tengchongensis]MBB5138427.1 putative oxidoreductase [Thermocatellispora tengchongensis]
MDRIDAALLVLRLVIGGVVVVHGLNHAFGGGRLPGAARWFESLGLRHGMAQAAMSAVMEVVAGVGLVIGLLTPIAAAAVIGVMLVAGVVAHRRNGFFVFRDGYEYVLVLGLGALVVAIAGPGGVSLDAALGIVVAGGWAALIAAGLGIAGAATLLAATYRPVRAGGDERAHPEHLP